MPTEVISVKIDLALNLSVVKNQLSDNNEDIIEKYALSKAGEWVPVPEGKRYPDECLFEPFISSQMELNDYSQD